jgi:hypothetical protein
MQKKLIYLIASIRSQLCGSLADYIGTRPTFEQKFWNAPSIYGPFKTAWRERQMYALMRYFVIRIGLFFAVRAAVALVAAWMLFFIGYVIVVLI